MLVLLLDQVESAPPDFSSAFFATIREMFVNRWMRPALHNISFVLAGRYVPDELIRDSTISPFRVTEIVYPRRYPEASRIWSPGWAPTAARCYRCAGTF
jgi:hypothetical protein